VDCLKLGIRRMFLPNAGRKDDGVLEAFGEIARRYRKLNEDVWV
jgi:hypothetical protein